LSLGNKRAGMLPDERSKYFTERFGGLSATECFRGERCGRAAMQEDLR
jgi:hypothetical protein